MSEMLLHVSELSERFKSNIHMFVIKWKVPSVFSLKIKSVPKTFKSNIVCKKKHSINVFSDVHNNQEKTVTLYNNAHYESLVNH